MSGAGSASAFDRADRLFAVSRFVAVATVGMMRFEEPGKTRMDDYDR